MSILASAADLIVFGTAVTEDDTKEATHVTVPHDSSRSGSFLSQTALRIDTSESILSNHCHWNGTDLGNSLRIFLKFGGF